MTFTAFLTLDGIRISFIRIEFLLIDTINSCDCPMFSINDEFILRLVASLLLAISIWHCLAITFHLDQLGISEPLGLLDPQISWSSILSSISLLYLNLQFGCDILNLSNKVID